MDWKDFANAVREITLEELMEKVEEERELARYMLAAPNTPSKALGSAFQNINIVPQTRTPTPNQYRAAQTNPQPASSFSSDRPPHERLANVINKALP